MIATAGDTARVDTQVAIALAVSWKPRWRSMTGEASFKPVISTTAPFPYLRGRQIGDTLQLAKGKIADVNEMQGKNQTVERMGDFWEEGLFAGDEWGDSPLCIWGTSPSFYSRD